MRLIDADALLEAVKDYPYGYRGMIESTISEQPTIDRDLDEWCETCSEYDAERHCCPRFNHVIKATVTEYEASMPVRCKDCKWWERGENDQGRCTMMKIYPLGKWYCANGRKRE